MLDIRALAYVAPVAEVDFASVALTVRIVNVADETGLITGKFRIYNGSTGLLLHTSEIVPVSLSQGQTIDASALTDFSPPAPADDTYFVMFDGKATNSLVPDGTIFMLGPFYFDVKPVGMGPAPAAHAPSHETGGSDEVDVTDLAGLLADAQTPLAHATSHETGGSDELDVTDLSGLLADAQTPLPHYHDKHLGIFLESDMEFGSTSPAPWNGGVIASGGLGYATPSGSKNHPGMITMVSSTSANSGAWINITQQVNYLLLAGTEETSIIFRPQTLAGTTIRLGLQDRVTASDITDGAYIEMAQVGGVDGVIVGKTANNSTRSSTGTSYTLVTNTWYRLHILVNQDATRVDFYLYSEAGALLWTDNLTTNIPTAAGRETGCGVVAFNSGTTALTLIEVDYINLSIERTLTR
jgi:hypothetical protein